MNKIKYPFVVLVAVVALSACAKKETRMSSESSVVESGRDVVEATGDILRNAAEGVNDAVYGRNK
jgi:hypothetical protein